MEFAPHNKSQGGFSLFEIVVSIIFFTLIALAATSSFVPWSQWKARMDTDKRISRLTTTIEKAYRESAWYIDGSDLPIGVDLVDAYGNLVRVTGHPPASNQFCQIDEALGSVLASYASTDSATLMSDGYGNPFCVSFTRRMEKKIGNSTLYYRKIVVISMGENASHLGGTAYSGKEYVVDAATGKVSAPPSSNVSNDDVYSAIDGYQIQKANYDRLVTRIAEIAAALDISFSSLYKNDSQGNPTYNYFDPDKGCKGRKGDIQSTGWEPQVDDQCPNAYAFGRPQAAGTIMNITSPEILERNIQSEINSDRAKADALMRNIGVSPFSADVLTGWRPHKNETPQNKMEMMTLFFISGCQPGVPQSQCMARTNLNPEGDNFHAEPPYTTIIGALLPGKSTITQTVMGKN